VKFEIEGYSVSLTQNIYTKWRSLSDQANGQRQVYQQFETWTFSSLVHLFTLDSSVNAGQHINRT